MISAATKSVRLYSEISLMIRYLPISPIVYAVAKVKARDSINDIEKIVDKRTLCMRRDMKRHNAEVDHTDILRAIDTKLGIDNPIEFSRKHACCPHCV